MALALAATLAVAAVARVSATVALPGRDMECVCTSTHFADVTFTVNCQRNSTGAWDSTAAENGPGNFYEQSSVSCRRGSPPSPRKDYRFLRNLGYYKFHPRQTTWEDALRTCAREGANMAVVNSEAEASALVKIFNEFPRLHEEDWLNNQAWVGVTDLKTEGIFLSLTGRTLKEEGYERWASDEPNNENDDEHCVAIDRNRLFNDEPCHIKLAFFCERKL